MKKKGTSKPFKSFKNKPFCMQKTPNNRPKTLNTSAPSSKNSNPNPNNPYPPVPLLVPKAIPKKGNLLPPE